MPRALAWSALAAFCLCAPAATAPALHWETGPGFRRARLTVPAQGRAGFELLPPERTGIFFTNRLSAESASSNRILENGSGVALGDVDGDGLCDIYFCRLQGGNVLYHNLGNWKFEDVTAEAGVACPGQFSTGAVLADVNGDGSLDLLVNGIGVGTRCFLNDGHGRFHEVEPSGLVRQFGSTSMALSDIDGDGDLDLYVANYRTDTFKDMPPGLKIQVKLENGNIVVSPPHRFLPLLNADGASVTLIEKGEPDFLYINKGRGRFGRVGWTSGAFVDAFGAPLKEMPLDWGLSVMFRDINGDGLPDIYVCNDFFLSPDRIWINEGGRRFRALPPLAMRHTSMSSMSIDFADVNRDGYDDFMVVDMLSRRHERRQRQRPSMLTGPMPYPARDPEFRPEIPRNTLFVNRGDGTYAELAQFSGLAASEWSWSVIFLDVDLDGYEDLLISNGNDHDVLDADTLREIRAHPASGPEEASKELSKFPPLITRNLAFRNRGDLTFEEVSAAWGFDTRAISQGMALGDLDNDGDLDAVVNNLNGAAGVYRNRSNAPRLAVRLRGLPPNTRGVGAKIRVEGGGLPTQSQQMICGGRYLSSDDFMRVFAAGNVTNRFRIEVTWRNGRQTVVANAAPNFVYEIDEAASAPAPAPPRKPSPAPWFEDVSAKIGARHQDEPFDDYARQPLLPRAFSQLGPGVAWIDWNGDGWDDLAMANGQGGRLNIFLNDQRGGFQRFELGDSPNLRDQTALASFVQNGRAQLLAGLSNYEDGQNSGASVRQFDAGGARDAVAAERWSPGPIALTDLDGAGGLELFVGGRIVPGRYPEACPSLLFRQRNGAWAFDEENSRALRDVGMVSGAIWSDLDNDGFPELILACEWGPVRVFKNDRGRLRESTRALGMDRQLGWWNGVATGDFDGDGRMDIVASNWGRNTRYQTVRKPLRIYYGDFAGDGGVVPLDAYEDPFLKKIVPWADYGAVSQAIPAIVERIPSYRAYSKMSLAEILGGAIRQASQWQCNCLDSMLFLNRGDHFEAHSLPGEAQWSPAFGVTVADFDGDGREDLFLSENFFDAPLQFGRDDSGRGLLLRGDGGGNLQPIPGQESGLLIYGEQRGCAAGDFDGDGRIDLAVAQNSGPLKLYRNRRARPGVRVRVHGRAGNEAGLGAALWLESDGWRGPVREIHAGGGYWSQDSLSPVLAWPPQASAPVKLRVRWPGGNEGVVPVPPGAREVAVRE